MAAGASGTSRTRQWALAYAALGWRVFPVVPGGKKPLYRGWQRDATTDADLISRYWRSAPAPNIGLICGEAFVAFDIEFEHLAAVSSWAREHGHRMPATPVARTGRAGVHVLVRPFSEGERNDFLFWASCRAAEQGLVPEAAGEILLAAARAAGLSDREATATIASGLAR